MFERMDNLKLHGLYEGVSVPYATYPGRPYHLFTFKASGSSVFRFADGHPSLSLSEGSMLFLPRGTSYTAVKTTADESRFISIRFHADLPPLPPKVFALPHPAEMQVFFRSMARRWLFGDPSRQYLCYAMFYELLATITAPSTRDYQTMQHKQLLQPGISYLEQSIFDPNLTVAQLAACCEISETYFRRIFQRIYNQSPKQYIQSKRLTHAHTILESGDFTTIQAVAALVGYDDPLYFSRAFKQKYGITPSEIQSSSIQKHQNGADLL